MSKKNLLTFVFSILISIVILEVGLRVFTPFPISKVSNKINHEKLGHIMDPDMDEIDEHGFRNNSFSSIDVVALGDSQTYGYNVLSNNSWPKILARRINKNIYNYGVGGYGILQYQYLLKKSIELNPDVILLGLYLANDLADVCKLVSDSQYWESKENEFSIDSSACIKKKNSEYTFTESIKNIRFYNVTNWLKEKSATISITLEYYYHFFPEIKVEDYEIEEVLIVDDSKIKTVISHKRINSHRKYMDLNEPDIKMGYEVLERFLLEAKESLELNNIRFGVLFIPSKERVFYKYLIKMDYSLSVEYRELVDNEDKLKETVALFLNEVEIPFVDNLQDMENALLTYGNIYPTREDGHPIEIGYQIYADNAFKLYKRITK